MPLMVGGGAVAGYLVENVFDVFFRHVVGVDKYGEPVVFGHVAPLFFFLNIKYSVPHAAVLYQSQKRK